jgi:RNA-directed DNA polymerase
MNKPGEKVTVSPAQTRCDWHSIDWRQAVEFVRKLRQEIFRATREGDLKKVRTLQEGGKYIRDNVRLVHLFCHQAEHRGKKRAKETE